MYLAREENILTGKLKTSDSKEIIVVLGAYFNLVLNQMEM